MAEVSLLRRISDSLALVLNNNVTVLFDNCTFCCYWIIGLINEIAIYLLELFYLVNSHKLFYLLSMQALV